MNVLLTSDEQVRSLNLQFRGLDETTDVLTFSSEDVPGAGLGDIAISVPYATRQAMQRQVTTDQELAFLAIHGVLHLLGYDDVEDEARNQMMREMHRVASSIGLPEESAWSSLLHEEAAS